MTDQVASGSDAINQKIASLEAAMLAPDFWADKARAQAAIKELAELKESLAGVGKYDKGDAIITLFSGAGGDDAEDFTRMLFEMYMKYVAKRGWELRPLSDTPNDHGGYRNISFEIRGKGAYGTLKNESGVHRLVRLSPFGKADIRQTSFSLVEVIPKFEKMNEMVIPPEDIRIETAKAGGPGGQNVNKRETAIRAIHIPTNLSVHVTSERSQQQNREKAIDMIKAKLYKKQEEDKRKKEKGMAISSTTDIEWGNQIRSYVLHPYKMVKDHRTEAETSNADRVLNGELDLFIEAEKDL